MTPPWARMRQGTEGPRSLSRLALSGSILLNAALLCYFVTSSSRKSSDSGESIALQTRLEHDTVENSIASTLSMLDARVSVSKGKEKVEYDAALKAEINKSLLQGLAQADAEEDTRLAQRERALRASDGRLAKPMSAGHSVRVPRQQTKQQSYQLGLGVLSVILPLRESIVVRMCSNYQQN
jgi:hypothetical protein